MKSYARLTSRLGW